MGYFVKRALTYLFSLRRTTKIPFDFFVVLFIFILLW